MPLESQPTLTCPHCKKQTTPLYVEDVATNRKLVSVETQPDGSILAMFYGESDVDWDACNNARLCCPECYHEWPIPENMTIDFY